MHIDIKHQMNNYFKNLEEVNKKLERIELNQQKFQNEIKQISEKCDFMEENMRKLMEKNENTRDNILKNQIYREEYIKFSLTPPNIEEIRTQQYFVHE